ncbi:predicted protein [Sclerotinia sclerotiorum 1980 UF-70]|uniref:Uncharacterized protein n=1 Tax=Sclerotinia sclerotiorum (strain ATCC 18683 / 1980 / Ss-1) TaxID=665079 RepID=A7EXT7_SCLS1|nr:predicted protein [Sclerotinia sclerotiorum 1980 UF-70]EDN94279.1 predicted protein [Sclerotinia sclerotiorum 1980 UF-70]
MSQNWCIEMILSNLFLYGCDGGKEEAVLTDVMMHGRCMMITEEAGSCQVILEREERKEEKEDKKERDYTSTFEQPVLSLSLALSTGENRRTRGTLNQSMKLG